MSIVWMIETKTRGSTGDWELFDCNGYGLEADAKERVLDLEHKDYDNQYRAAKYVPMYGNGR